MQIVPLDAGLGAEVREVDLDKPISAAMFEALRAAWQTHLVLVFRDQRLTDPALIRFAEGFGTIEPPGPNPYGGPLHKTHPELNVISNIKEAGKPIGNLGDGEAVWHADMTYTDVPPLGAILYAIELPAVGGDTHFANMYRAYEALPAALKEQLSSLRAIHDASHNSAGILRRGYEPVTDVTKTPGAVHPLVRTNAATGKRCLFLGRRPRSYVPGLDVDKSDALLDELWRRAVQPEFTYIHRWRIGDVLMWDNLSVLHRRDAFDPGTRRLLHRAQIGGTQTIS